MRKTWIAGVAVAIAAPALAPTAALRTPAGMNPLPDRPEPPPASGEIGLPPMSPWLLSAHASAPRGEPLALCDCAMDRAGARPALLRIQLPPPADAARRGAPAPLPPPVGGHGGGHGGAGGPAPVPVVPVPEPSAWLMMIAGLGLVGLALRRRRAIAWHEEGGVSPALSGSRPAGAVRTWRGRPRRRSGPRPRPDRPSWR